MSKLYFRYGAMNSSKSLNLLATAHNYKSQDKSVLLLKPNIDIRSASGYIESRSGLNAECIDIDKTTNLVNLFIVLEDVNEEKYSCILVDEAQFLTKQQVVELAEIVDRYNVPVICYGLKNSYINLEIFEGSQALLYCADKIEEIKTICSCKECNRKAIFNLRVLEGKPIYNGDIINCGDTKPTEDYYIPVCRKHYYNPEL